MSHFTSLRYSDPEDRMFDRIIYDVSIVLRETTLTISDSIVTGTPVESEIERVVSLSTTKISEITRFKKKIPDPQGLNTLTLSQTSPGFYVPAVQIF